MNRSFVFALPLLSLLVACADPIVGSWTLTPQQGELTMEDGSTVAAEVTGNLEVLSSFETTFDVTVTSESVSGTTNYAGTTTPDDKGGYAMALTSGDFVLNISCEIGEDSLSCTDESGEGGIEFTPAE